VGVVHGRPKEVTTAARYPRVVVRALAMFVCEWCSVEDASRYTRFGSSGPEPSQDTIDLCDECAKLLRDRITFRLREGKRRR
jgi:hypothetical protein